VTDLPGKEKQALSVQKNVEKADVLETKRSAVPAGAERSSEARVPTATQTGPKVPFRKRALPLIWKWSKRLAVTALVLAIVGLIAIVIVVRHYEADLPSVADLKGNYHPPQVTRVLARDGTTLAEIFTERRTVVAIATLPAHVKLALLAAEDAGFYEHEGLNYWGIARAFAINVRSGRTRQGGSTITQQVVKNLLLGQERTYSRKIREALLARKLEQELSKDEILELYLNHIYFGDGNYGIEEAARGTFGKSAKDLTIAEAALLAGLPAGPDRFSPRKHLDRTLVRRAYVLDQMHQKGFLNDAQFAASKDEPIKLAGPSDAEGDVAPEVVELAKKALRDLVHDDATRGGYTISTTIDPKLQASARKSVQTALDAYDKKHGLLGPLKLPAQATVDKKGRTVPPPKPTDPPFTGTPEFSDHRVLVGVVEGTDDSKQTIDIAVGTAHGTVRLEEFKRYNPLQLTASAFAPMGAWVRVSLLGQVPDAAKVGDGGAPAARVPLRLELGPEGAMVAIDVRSRQVVALVGNYEAASGGLDRATHARRQPGSTFKPVVYSYAIHSRRFTAASLIDPRPEVFPGGYKPANYEGYTGTDFLRLRECLANSVNVCAVRVLADVGPANVVSWAQSLGIASTLKPDLSLALGSYEIQPIELAGAYATFAAGGTYDTPRIVTRITGPDGKDLELAPLPPPRRVLDEAEAYLITSMLTSVVDHGTAVQAKSLGRPVAGKTGTSNAAKDTWFAGYSTETAAVVWIGFDDGKSLGARETGASVALPAWIDFMKAASEHKPPSQFPKPAGIVQIKIDKATGMLPPDDDLQTQDEVFLAGTEPTEVAAAPVLDGGTQGENADSSP